MRVLRNIAIIAGLAFVVTAVPGGGNAAEAIVTAISLMFLAVIAFAVYQLYRSQSFTVMSLSDRQRATLVVAVGVIVLMVAGADEMLDTGLGALAWIGLLGASGVAIWRLWLDARAY